MCVCGPARRKKKCPRPECIRKAPVRLRAIRARRRTARRLERQARRQAHPCRIQASGDELPPRGADYSARAGSARCLAGRRGTLHRNGRPLRTQLLSTGSGFLRVSRPRISFAQELPGRFAAHRETTARSARASRASAENLRRVFEAFSAFAKEARSGRIAGGIGAAPKQQQRRHNRAEQPARKLSGGKNRWRGRSATERSRSFRRQVGGLLEFRGNSADTAHPHFAQRRRHARNHRSRKLRRIHFRQDC